MSNSKNASLVLTTSSATANNVGKTSHTWYSINLRTLLGDMFDKYETFNLCLNTIHTAVPPSSGYGASTDDYNVLIKITGLPFINNTYNVATRTNTNSTVIGTFQFATPGASFQYFYGSNIAQFGRYQNMCDITIEYYKIVDTTLLASNTASKAFPDVCFIFDIFPIDEVNKLNGSRMFT